MAPTKKRVAQLRRARAARFQPKVAEPVVEPTTTAAVPASRPKLSFFSSVDSVDLASVTAIIQLNAIQPLFEKFACPECSDGHFTLSCDSNKSAGLALFFIVACNKCSYIMSSCHTSHKCDTNFFEINRRAVASSLATGMGHADMGKFFEMMNIPNVHQKTYNQHATAVYKNVDSYKESLLQQSVQQVRAAYPEQADKDIVDIDVSYDGSWHTRGHTSKSGIGCIIDNKTVLVVDFQCLS